MSKPERSTLLERVRRCGPEAILRAASLCDGHSILDPDALISAGLPPAVVEQLTVTHRSDGTPKGTIFVGDRAVGELRGVSGLDVLVFLADAFGVEYRPAFGRGTRAHNIRAALRRHLAPVDDPPPAA